MSRTITRFGKVWTLSDVRNALEGHTEAENWWPSEGTEFYVPTHKLPSEETNMPAPSGTLTTKLKILTGNRHVLCCGAPYLAYSKTHNTLILVTEDIIVAARAEKIKCILWTKEKLLNLERDFQELIRYIPKPGDWFLADSRSIVADGRTPPMLCVRDSRAMNPAAIEAACLDGTLRTFDKELWTFTKHEGVSI